MTAILLADTARVGCPPRIAASRGGGRARAPAAHPRGPARRRAAGGRTPDPRALDLPARADCGGARAPRRPFHGIPGLLPSARGAAGAVRRSRRNGGPRVSGLGASGFSVDRSNLGGARTMVFAKPVERPTGRELVRLVERNLARGAHSEWSAADDLAVVAGFSAGLKADGVARAAKRTRTDVIARFRRLIPDPTPDTQRVTMEVLRARIHEAGR